MDILSKALRLEKSKQISGEIHLSHFKTLKESHYYPVDIALDGDAPKQYIKAYFYFKKCPRISTPKRWDGYFVKFGGKSYPHESITEYIINQIGDSLGLIMNETKLMVINKQLRFLSKDFLKSGEKLVHGVELLSEYFEDKEFVDEINKDKKQRREFLTFDEIENAFKHVHPVQMEELLAELVKMITYDAIVGNNDRHFYNWGIISNVKKANDKKVKFAPIYDTARALFWNDTEDHIKEILERIQSGQKSIEGHCNKSKPRFSYSDKINANHFDLIEFLCLHNKDYRLIIMDLISKQKEIDVFEKLKNECYRFISKQRRDLIDMTLKFRFKKLREITNERPD
jgi:hypothetical protein